MPVLMRLDGPGPRARRRPALLRVFMTLAVAGVGCGNSASSGSGGRSASGGEDASGTDGSGSAASSSSGGSGSGTASGSSSSGSSGAGASSGSSGSSGGTGPSSSSGSGESGTGQTCTPTIGAGAGDDANCTPPTPPTAKDSVTLDMATAEGAPTYLASGFIYGIAQDGSQPPDALLTDIKVKGLRAGRGVVDQECSTQTAGLETTNFGVIQAYYARAKALGANFRILVSDDYGYVNCPIPGAGGDWTQFTTFLSQLISEVQAAGMTGPDVLWELWNEPEVSIFWSGTQAQWLATWQHAYQQVRAAIPDAVIEGPSLATGPGGSWMNAFLDYAKANDVMPDYITWHEEGGGADPVADLATIKNGLMTRGITGVKGFDVNEYGTTGEQNPGHSAWYLARFDRAGIQGLRGNWADGTEFFSNMADLVAPNWQPNSQYWIYKRYADQTGLRTSVTPGSQVDAVGYEDSCAAKSIIVVGNKGGVTGAVNVVIENIPSWLQSGGSTKVLLEKMPTGDAALNAPVVVSNASAAVTCNSIAVTIDWATATDGYVVTLSPP